MVPRHGQSETLLFEVVATPHCPCVDALNILDAPVEMPNGCRKHACRTWAPKLPLALTLVRSAFIRIENLTDQVVAGEHCTAHYGQVVAREAIYFEACRSYKLNLCSFGRSTLWSLRSACVKGAAIDRPLHSRQPFFPNALPPELVKVDPVILEQLPDLRRRLLLPLGSEAARPR